MELTHYNFTTLFKVYQGLLLSPEKHSSIHVQRMNKKMTVQDTKGIAFKRRRIELKKCKINTSK